MCAVCEMRAVYQYEFKYKYKYVCVLTPASISMNIGSRWLGFYFRIIRGCAVF